MALTSTKLNISFSLDSSPKEFVFTDVTDYAAQSVTASDISGSIKVTAPSGVVYGGQSNDIDIQPLAGGYFPGRINQNQILIPLLSDSTPEVGQYTFEYTATDGVDTVTYTKTINFQYVKPVAGINTTYDCLSPQLTTEDTTNYLYGSIAPSDRFNISSADAVGNTFSISGEKSAFVRVGDTFSIISSTGNDGDYTVTSVAYNQVLDTTIVGVASVVDGTADGVLVTRKSEIFYPQVLGLNPLVGYSKKLQTSVFYTNTHEFKYETKSFYDLTDGVSIVDSNTDNQELDIQCDVRLCEIFCCINAKFNEYLTYKNNNNKTLATYALDQYIVATSHLAALRTAFECGKSQAVTDLTDQIKEVTKCNGDCSCEDGSPVLVTGLGGGTNTVVQSSGNGITVSSITAGDTTTYTLSLSQAILDDIAAGAATSSVVGGSGITVTSNSVGDNTEYTVGLTTPQVVPVEMMSFNVTISNIAVGSATFAISDLVIQNETNLDPLNVSVGLENTTPVDHAQAFKIENFQKTPNTTYKAFIEILENTSEISPAVGPVASWRYDYMYNLPTFRISRPESGKIEFVMIKGGFPYAIQTFGQHFEEVKLNVKIIE